MYLKVCAANIFWLYTSSGASFSIGYQPPTASALYGKVPSKNFPTVSVAEFSSVALLAATPTTYKAKQASTLLIRD